MVMIYQQEVRDTILKAVNYEIPIWEAALMIEKIILKHLEGE
jgi:hypothetical protein